MQSPVGVQPTINSGEEETGGRPMSGHIWGVGREDIYISAFIEAAPRIDQLSTARLFHTPVIQRVCIQLL